MEAIVQRQSDIVDSIKQIERNFAKDSASRKTRKYIDERLDALDRLWAEFQANHDKLSAQASPYEPYFTGNEYDRMRKYYDSVRTKISTSPTVGETAPSNTLQVNPPSPLPEDVKLRSTTMHTTSTSASHTPTTAPSRTSADDLLSLQRTSFRAFRRLLRGINVEDITDKWELEDELRNIQTRWNAIDSLHLQIDNLLQGSDLQYEEEFYSMEESFKTIKKALNRKFASTAHLQQSTPRIEIPTFTGSYVQWPTFVDLYTGSIHNNNLLTKCQKMQHLKGKLRGEAERLIQHLSITADNYDAAWELIVHRYNNPQLLFTKHVELFLSQPVVQKQTSFEIKRLFDTSSECIHAIQNLGVDVSSWDPLLVHLISKKLDSDTYGDYKEARKSPRDLPTLKELMDFLETKFTALEPIQKRDREPIIQRQNQHNMVTPLQPQNGYRQNRGGFYKKHQAIATYTWTCPLCKQAHSLFKCAKFNNLNAIDKVKTVEKLRVCKNCLYVHTDNVCNSTSRCKHCQQNHNTILHDALIALSRTQSVPSTSTMPHENKQHKVNHVATEDEEILLTTVSIKVRDINGSLVTLRALLDQGSQISLISEKAVQMLGLPRQKYQASVSGIGNGAKNSKGIVHIDCTSINDDYSFSTQALVINKVINNLPNASFTKQSWAHLNCIQLADPEYNVSKPIDMLLDASIYSEIIMTGLIKGSNTAPIAQQTRLGWILSGNVKTFMCNVVVNNITDLTQYWELEDIQDSSPDLTQEEEYCEQLYKNTTRRLSSGRYEVALPMKPGYEEKLGKSKPKAVAQFYNLENKMQRNDIFSDSYKQFMKEYEAMNHMTQVTSHSQTTVECYLPHHGVLKLDSSTTKLRTVFNASAKTTSGHSLNDLMERGPNLQKDLHSLILTWRKHRYVISADIEKMFRQILIREEDQSLQQIVWRTLPQEPLRDYKMLTVTYGTKAAPYLAMRTLKQLAIDDKEKYPLASKTLMTSFYMDDLLEGGSTIEQTKQLQREIIDILQGAGMNIRKWSSNTDELTSNLTAEQIDTPLDFRCAETKRTLGLRWSPSTDAFTFQNLFTEETKQSDRNITKRQLLSNISKIFDPLGWLSPLTIRAKLLFQKTWTQENLGWNDTITDAMNNEWKLLASDFSCLDRFQVARYFGERDKYQIHGFCDASEKAYACVIYIITRQDKGKFTSTMITAKTKLAPLKNKISLPKLELCGALLLTQLMNKVTQALSEDNIQKFAWTDSMVVLGWIHGDINRWKTFVAHRVKKIIDSIPAVHWHHVSSKDNAADCATRGLTATQLVEQSLWWSGPEWLKTFDQDRLKGKRYEASNIEVKRACVNATLHKKSDLVTELLTKYSSIHCVITSICWLRRFCNWLHKKTLRAPIHLTLKEITDAYYLIIKTVQANEFEDEIRRIQKGKGVRHDSKLACFTPYIDQNEGILRIRGRLNNANLLQSAKHPIIIPSRGRFTELIIQQAHFDTLHGGPRLTLCLLREKYWILSGLQTVKKELRKCVKCRRYNNEKRTQMMADLPRARVTPSRPFTHTGVDYTGFFDIKANKGRGIKTCEGYVAVFVCLATKAVHLELVSDLSTQGFLAAFRRFSARRGTPCCMYSDNGTNFTGANKLLQKEHKQILQTFNSELLRNLSNQQIGWKFNAPAYPSAGGLWEAAVKSLKYHLKRVVGEQKLTYEEFTTLLHQVEACLNSRPLTPLTENPDDAYLTPGHFLIGGPLLARSQTDPDHLNLSTRWQLVQAMNKQIWKRWSSEYLQTLQTRGKWKNPTRNIQTNDIVLIRDDNLPPGKWNLGKVTEVHPGADGLVRVVSVKTKNGIIKRPILKLTQLPVNADENESAHTARSTNLSEPIDDVNTLGNTNLTRPREQKRKGTNLCLNILSTILLLCTTMITPAKSECNITEFNNNQEIYFDRLYDMSLIRDEWKLIIYYNMTTYWAGVNHVQEYVNHFDSYLGHIQPLPKLYSSILFQLQHELTEIEHNNKLLRNRAERRQKRGLVNGVGYLANSLFGVLDDRFAKAYEKDIEKIQMNENHLQRLLKNQTSIIEAQYNILHRNEGIMNKQFKTIEKHLQEMTFANNQMQAEVKSELYLLSSMMAAEIVISNIRHIQDKLLDTITDLSHGHIDTHLLSPDQLEEQVNLIYRNLPTELTLPAKKEDLHELYKLTKINVKVGVSFLIIEACIPLVSKDTFQVDQLIGLPQTSYTVQTAVPYIAFNLPKDFLMLLTENDLQSCTHITADQVMCSINRPVHDLKISNTLCNLTLHNKKLCHTKLSTCDEQWIKLHHNNRWVYSCCEKCNIRVFCPDRNLEMKNLIGNGLIDIGQGCSIKGNKFTIQGHRDYISYTESQNNIPNLPSEISILNHVINTTRTVGQYKPEDHDKEWQQIKSQMDDIKQQDMEPLSIHDVHQYSLLYTILIMFLLSGLVYFAVKCRRRAIARGQLTVVGTSPTTSLPQPPPQPRRVREPSRAVEMRGIKPSHGKEERHSSSRSVDTATSPMSIPRSCVQFNIPSITSDSE